MAKVKSVPDRIVEALASVRTALFVLFALAAAAVAGTIIPQNEAPRLYLQEYGPVLYTFLSYLDMYDMYHSWWFNLLLGLLVANLVVCSIDRLPSVVRLARPADASRIKPGYLEKQSFTDSFRLPGSPEDNQPRLAAAIARHFGRPQAVERDWGRLLAREKGAFSRFGVYLVHSSILFIVVGAAIGNIWGFSAFLNLSEGETADRVQMRRGPGTLKLPFSIRLDDFDVQFYETGQPSDYLSEVTIIEDGRPVETADIRVNHPLTYRGVTFYQSSYGRTTTGRIGVRLRRLPEGEPFGLELPTGGEASLPGGRGRAGVIDFTDNLMNAGPAAKLLIRPADGPARTLWAFKDRPDFLPEPEGWQAELTSFEIGYYTGLQVNRDPGVVFIWIGCGVMLAGFLVAFFFAHRRIFAGLIEEEGGTRVLLAGTSHRNPGSFKIKFEALAEEARAADKDKDSS